MHTPVSFEHKTAPSYAMLSSGIAAVVLVVVIAIVLVVEEVVDLRLYLQRETLNSKLKLTNYVALQNYLQACSRASTNG